MRRALKDIAVPAKVEEPEGEVSYKVLSSVEGEDGTVYSKVVQPGSGVYEKVKRNHDDYIAYLHRKIFNRKISVFNADNESIVVEFAKDGETVHKVGAKQQHIVLGKLERTDDRLKMIAIINIKELLQNSTPEPIGNKHSHRWLDELGWSDRKVFMLNNGQLYPVILHIANTRDGRHILYDVSVIKKEKTGLTRYAKAPTADTARAPDTANEHRSAVKNPVSSSRSVPQTDTVVKRNSSTDSNGETGNKLPVGISSRVALVDALEGWLGGMRRSGC